MPSQNEPPFPRGEIFTEYVDDVTADTSAPITHEGKEFYFEDKNWSGAAGGVVPDRTNLLSKCRIVRNSSGGVLTKKTFIKNKIDGTTSAANIGRTAGVATAVTDALLGVVDEHLSQTVPDGALFWAVVEGPTVVTTDSSGDTNIPAGQGVIPATSGTAVQSANQTNAEVRAFCTLAVNATAADCFIKLLPPRL